MEWDSEQEIQPSSPSLPRFPFPGGTHPGMAMAVHFGVGTPPSHSRVPEPSPGAGSHCASAKPNTDS